ncbi:hypothetical protein L1987_20707 [Smallanthus sonchifolius]|uniref:Uncharacterized protein n=1 Tax=Smallanthus sonchifolius TaxID=185202 RepID=A0ACB9IU19_9ASTR|nr:hypothetical protein L1987_20707 [Smallanthus sonchifolius]
MTHEDEVTSYVSCTSVSTNSVSDNENVSVKKGVDCVIVEDEELSADLCVPKNVNISRENYILVEPDVPIEPKPYVKQVIFPKLPVKPKSGMMESDRFVKEKVAQQPKRIVREKVVSQSKIFVQEKVVQKPRVFEKAKGGQHRDVKLSKPHRRRRNKQLQKLLFQTNQFSASKKLKSDRASTSRVPNVGGMGFSKSF